MLKEKCLASTGKQGHRQHYSMFYSSVSQAGDRHREAMLSSQQWMGLRFSDGSITNTFSVQAGYLTSFCQIQQGYIFSYPFTMLSNNTYLICRKVMRLRYLISTVCFEISKGLNLCSQMGQEQALQMIRIITRKTQIPKLYLSQGVLDIRRFLKESPLPHRSEVFTLPKNQATDVNTELEYRVGFQ